VKVYIATALTALLLTTPAAAYEPDRSPLGVTRTWHEAPPAPTVRGDQGWLSATEIEKLADEAAASWSDDEAASFAFGPRDRTSRVGEIVIVHGPWPHGENEIAYTTITDDGAGGLRSYRIELDGRVDFCARCRTEGRFPLDRVLRHELGHALGLAHSTDRRALMAPAFRVNEALGTTLAEDDRRGLRALYPRAPGAPKLASPKPAPRWSYVSLGFVGTVLGLSFVASRYRFWRPKKASVTSVAT
jgi:hypothetical protein